MRLALIPGVGPLTQKALLTRFGSARAVLDAAPSELRQVSGVGVKLCRSIVAAREEIDVLSELSRCRENDIAILTETDADYPRMLKEISDPPCVLFAKGKFLPQDAIAIAIVGTRHASRYGLDQAYRLASELARAGLTVVSGLARGIDSAAHRGALAAGGRTLAVLGSGLLTMYPPEHEGLAREVIQSGVLLSELPTLTGPQPGTFPQRNRIITGLSLGVIVVEAGKGSGALISARLSMEQNREVFAVPGRVDVRTFWGCHRLLRDGAKLVETADDVLEELGPLVEATPREDGRVIRHPAEFQLNEQETAVLNAIDQEPTGIDQVAAESGLPISRVLSTISVLEMRRLVRRVSGNLVART